MNSINQRSKRTRIRMRISSKNSMTSYDRLLNDFCIARSFENLSVFCCQATWFLFWHLLTTREESVENKLHSSFPSLCHIHNKTKPTKPHHNIQNYTMTRVQTITKTSKTCYAKRSSAVDMLYTNGRQPLVCLQLPISKPLTSTSCLNSIFSDLSVTRPRSNSRGWGSMGSRRKRSSCLISLVDDCKKNHHADLGDGAGTPAPPQKDTFFPAQQERRASVSWGLFADSSENGEAAAQTDFPLEFWALKGVATGTATSPGTGTCYNQYTILIYIYI